MDLRIFACMYACMHARIDFHFHGINKNDIKLFFLPCVRRHMIQSFLLQRPRIVEGITKAAFPIDTSATRKSHTLALSGNVREC